MFIPIFTLESNMSKKVGRKRLDDADKKTQKQIYLPRNLFQQICDLDIKGCKSFSSKTVKLIEKGIEKMSEKKSMEDDFDREKKIRIADLFAGMGGIRIGFEQALQNRGLESKTVFVSEIKHAAVSVYKDNFPDAEITGDITKVDEKDIPDIDFLLAGFPCQSFSSAGKRLGFQDTRGTLFFDVARVIKAKKPKGFILENVEGLVTHDHGKTLKTIMNVLNDLGYKSSYKVLNSAEFGLAQARKRIYIVGTLDGEKPILENFDINGNVTLSDVIDYNVPAENDDFAKKLLSEYTLEQVEGKQIKDKRGGSNNIHSWDFSLKGRVTDTQKELLDCLLKQRRNKKWADIIGIDWMDGMPLTLDMIRTFFDSPNLKDMLDDLVDKGYLKLEYPKKKTDNGREYDKKKPKGYNIVTGKLSFRYSKILSPNEVTPTLVATDLSHLAVPVKDGIRPMTRQEALKLFGYPETYSLDSVSPQKAYDLLGNTVAVSVIEKVADKLLDALNIK